VTGKKATNADGNRASGMKDPAGVAKLPPWSPTTELWICPNMISLQRLQFPGPRFKRGRQQLDSAANKDP
jgi:hypothetical protein